MKQIHRQNSTKNNDRAQVSKPKSSLPKIFKKKRGPKNRIIFQTTFGGTTPPNEAKTQARHHKKLQQSTNTQKNKSSLPKISRNADLRIGELFRQLSGEQRHAMKQKHRQNIAKKYRQSTKPKTKSSRPKIFSKRRPKKKRMFQTALGGTTPCNEAKTMAKHQQAHQQNRYAQKPKSLHPKILSRRGPKTRRVFSDSFRRSNATQQNIGETVPKHFDRIQTPKTPNFAPQNFRRTRPEEERQTDER